uniref:Major capsid protein N-terminal domain-containing protein n=1 Tax=viral metagenome TaxID=1070528 RepID=A0A6C0F5A6_9ZZZZ
MGGGTLQLVATGGQDIHLIGNPGHSFFKSVFRKHTNFSIECIDIQYTGNIKSGKTELDFEIPRIGDLLGKMHFEIDLPDQTVSPDQTGGSKWCSYSNTTGFSFLDELSIEIGGELIDKHDGRWYDILNELTGNGASGQSGDNLDYLINKITTWPTEANTTPKRTQMYIPLKFWFCKDYSNALPLIALQYHHVNIKATFRGIKNIINSQEDISNNPDVLPPNEIKLWGNYIFLDSDERKRFAKESHEYLIEQVQLVDKPFSKDMEFNLNHPIKSLYWVIQNEVALTEKDNFTDITSTNNITSIGGLPWSNGNDFLNYNTHLQVNPSYLQSTIKYEHFNEMNMKFNGIDRFPKRKATYFRTIQPLEHGYYYPEKNIYMYSFSLNPNSFDASGSCNFSRIDNFTLHFDGDQQYLGYKLFLYAVNYNILRIMSGYGGLLYSN